jgi:hypothetical protein
VAVAVLGGKSDAQRIETLRGNGADEDEHFYLHYFFPPSSVGEVGGQRGPGQLAQGAMLMVVVDAAAAADDDGGGAADGDADDGDAAAADHIDDDDDHDDDDDGDGPELMMVWLMLHGRAA